MNDKHLLPNLIRKFVNEEITAEEINKNYSIETRRALHNHIVQAVRKIDVIMGETIDLDKYPEGLHS